MIDKNSIDRLKDVIDIVDIISSYIDLKRVGANYIAPCPFHNEKSPSFIVSSVKGYFKCYGCGIGGDSFNFIMQYENLSFYESVEKIAYMYNFTLNYTGKKEDAKLSDILELISKYYQSNLDDNIVSYLQNRGISNGLIEKFKLGYSGNSNKFIDFIKQKQINFQQLLELGILGKNNRGYYAKFNSRIMFPIHSPSGKLVGFGGRIIEGEGAKYLNSPQSSIFNKSKLLYGYYLAKDSIFKEKKIIITEGYIDSIMLFQAGFNNSVATLGTSLTKEHIPLLSKGNIDVIVCYDGDKAGINAAYRASLLLMGRGGGVVIIKDGKDPADMVKEGKNNELISLINNPTPFVEFIVDMVVSKYNISNAIEKEKAFNELKVILKDLSSLLKEEYKDYIALKLGIPVYLLENMNKDSKHISNETKLNNTKSANTKLVEDVIIKSILENKALFSMALDYITIDIFEHKKKEFSLLLDGNINDASLIGILLDNSIKPLDLDGFKQQLRLLILHFYKKKLYLLKLNKNLKYEIKLKELNKINNKIARLKSGELVSIT